VALRRAGMRRVGDGAPAARGAGQPLWQRAGAPPRRLLGEEEAPFQPISPPDRSTPAAALPSRWGAMPMCWPPWARW
jgi:hypothetical protein